MIGRRPPQKSLASTDAFVTLQRVPPLTRILAPGFFAPSKSTTEADGFSRRVKIAAARPAAPAPTPAPDQALKHAPTREHDPKRRDGFAPFAPARDKRPPQTEPDHLVKPEPHTVKPEPHPAASGHQPKPHAGAKPRPHAKPYPGAKPRAHAKPSYVKPSYMKPSFAKPHARPKDKHRKG